MLVLYISFSQNLSFLNMKTNIVLLSAAVAALLGRTSTASELCSSGKHTTCCDVKVKPTAATKKGASGSGVCSSSSDNFNVLSTFHVCRNWSTQRLFNKLNTQFMGHNKCFR